MKPIKTFWISMGKCIPRYLHTVTEGSVWEGKGTAWGLSQGSGHKSPRRVNMWQRAHHHCCYKAPPRSRESPRFFLNNTPVNEELKQPEWNKAHTSHGRRRQRTAHNWLEKEEKYRIAAFTWSQCFSRTCTIQCMLCCCVFFHPFISIFKCVSCKQIF